ESLRYREFMGWSMPWYSAQASLEQLLPGRELGLFHLVTYVREGDRVFETYWTRRRGVQAMDNSYALMDLTVWGRQEEWEDSPPGWPQDCTNVRTDSGAPDWLTAAGAPQNGTKARSDSGAPDWLPAADWRGGPASQWPRLDAGRSDDLRG